MSNPLPPTVYPIKFNLIYAITIVGMHFLGAVALAALAFGPEPWRPYLFSWTAFALFLVGIHLFGQGITIGYHRLLTHRSFKTPKWLEHWIAILGICSMQDTPARWVTIHRIHHVHSDEIPDPHSPRVTFWWSHMGWLMYINRDAYSVASLEKFSKDLLRDPFYMRLETNPFRQFYYIFGQVVVFFALGFLLSFIWSSEISAALAMGSTMVVWAFIMRVIAVWHITWSVNSLSHMFGYQSYETKEDSKNNWFVALMTVGEGWHNNHHEDPSAATVQHRWWELDLSYYEIKLLEKLGLASDVIPTRIQRRNEQAAVKQSSKQAPTAADQSAPESKSQLETASQPE
jgi:fatty-acid desaturase